MSSTLYKTVKGGEYTGVIMFFGLFLLIFSIPLLIRTSGKQ
jgi:archaellum biogenesis protein FlaJ (TadC family)